MKGFTKGKGKGKKFIPTSRKKSGLKINQCVSKKIPKLRHEGKPQDQSIAIAESVCRRKKETLDKDPNKRFDELFAQFDDVEFVKLQMAKEGYDLMDIHRSAEPRNKESLDVSEPQLEKEIIALLGDRKRLRGSEIQDELEFLGVETESGDVRKALSNLQKKNKVVLSDREFVLS